MMKNRELIRALQNCITECLKCADACLDEDDLGKMVTCIRTDRACAETCSATANLLAMNAPNAGEMVKVCKDICERCHDECNKHDHQHCRDCAQACKECAEACQKFAA